jgi:inner membrane protein
MDSITHITLGAVLGDAMLGKSLGKRAMILGAAAQFCPDGDVIAALWLPVSENLLAHRGITHSFFFVVMAGSLFGVLAYNWNKRSIPIRSWLTFFVLQLFIHVFLDAFNAYSVGWLEPFISQRFSFNTIFVADPFFSVWIGIGFIALCIMKNDNPLRFRWILFVLLTSCGYIVYCVYNKYTIDRDVRKSFSEQQIEYNRYFTTPTPFNNWLWYVVAEDAQGFHVGYRSVFDSKPAITFQYFSKNDSLLQHLRSDQDLVLLQRFSQGYYTIEESDGHLLFNDLRFGQQAGWYNPQAPFVFSFDLTASGEDLMAIQRGRMAGWNKDSIRSMLQRIRGN